MERALGRDLDAIVEERGPLPWPEAIEYVRQTCAALGEAHVHGIVHRDIKPGNVLVGTAPTGEPLVKVVDFGVAKEGLPPGEEASGLTSTSVMFGTPEYMSPEQRRSTRDVDHRTDIWSLGATMFFTLVGRAPFAADSLAELMELIQHGPTPSVRAFRPDVPPEIDAVIARCLHRDPHGRFKSTTEIVAALTPFAAGAVPAPGSTDPLLSVQFPEPPSDPTPVMTEAPAERTVAMPSPPVRPEAVVPPAPSPPLPTPTGHHPFAIAVVVILLLAMGAAVFAAFVVFGLGRSFC